MPGAGRRAVQRSSAGGESRTSVLQTKKAGLQTKKAGRGAAQHLRRGSGAESRPRTPRPRPPREAAPRVEEREWYISVRPIGNSCKKSLTWGGKTRVTSRVQGSGAQGAGGRGTSRRLERSVSRSAQAVDPTTNDATLHTMSAIVSLRGTLPAARQPARSMRGASVLLL